MFQTFKEVVHLFKQILVPVSPALLLSAQLHTKLRNLLWNTILHTFDLFLDSMVELNDVLGQFTLFHQTIGFHLCYTVADSVSLG